MVTPATAQDRAQVAALAAQVQAVTGEPVALAFVDHDYTGEAAADAAAEPGIRLEVVKLPTSKRGFVLLPRRWVVERASRGRRLSVAWHARMNGCRTRWRACIFWPFAIVLLKRFVTFMVEEYIEDSLPSIAT